MSNRKTPEDYHILAKSKNLIWAGPEVSSVKSKTVWGCRQNHLWESSYDGVRNTKFGCPYCSGSGKRGPKDYQILAKKHGIKWLGPKVKATNHKTGWQCKDGHKWESTYQIIRMGCGCPACGRVKQANNHRKNPDDYHALAKNRGFIWLGPEVRKARDLTTWQCSEGHRWEARYYNIYSGRGCPVCAEKQRADKRRIKPRSYHALAKKRGFKWLGPEVSTVNIKTTWQCSEGHEWKAAYATIKYGNGCPHCAGKAPRKSKDYHALAKERGFTWIGPEVTTIDTKTNWQCPKGHKWETTYYVIKMGCGCPSCAGLSPKTDADYHALAKERGFTWLGASVPNVRTKTTWQCVEGHEWEATYDKIRQGQGCPICSESKGEKTIAILLGKLKLVYERQFVFSQCRSIKGASLRFDFAIFASEDLYLIEYDGEQHFEPNNYFGGIEAFESLVDNDKIKDNFARNNNIPLLRIPYTDFDNIETIIIDWLNSLQDKPTRMDKPPKGVSKAYKSKNSWKIATQLSLLDT